MPIDYSKWNNFQDSSEDEEEETKHSYSKPRVTKIENSGTVTRSPDGTITIEKKKSSPENEDNSEKSTESFLSKNGDSFIDSKTRFPILWSQDRYEVNISIPFDANDIQSKSIQVKCVGYLSYNDRSCASMSVSNTQSTDESHGSLTIMGIQNHQTCTILQGALPHFVHLPQDEDFIDWYIENNCYSKFQKELQQNLPSFQVPTELNILKITLLKAVPMEGMFIWWDQLLVHCPKINTEAIGSRNEKQRFDTKSVWDEAHEKFRQKIKNDQVKQAID